MDYQSLIIIPEHTQVYRTLDGLASEASVVCFSGLPAVGKSLYIQQFSYLALSKGRKITTLQWDIARQAFETEDMLSRYPEAEGITNPVIRKACGLWARKAVYDWSRQNEDPEALLIIEAPLIGNRLVELAASIQDEAEIFLSGQAVQFVLPVPTAIVRAAIEIRRRETTSAPKHAQEKADASPFVVAVLAKKLCEVAVRLAYPGPAQWHEYDPLLYEFVYREVLKYRNFHILKIDFLVDSKDSVYAFDGSEKRILVPGVKDTADSIKVVESIFPAADQLQASVDTWYLVDPAK